MLVYNIFTEYVCSPFFLIKTMTYIDGIFLSAHKYITGNLFHRYTVAQRSVYTSHDSSPRNVKPKNQKKGPILFPMI